MSVFEAGCPALSQKLLLNPHSVHSAEVEALPRFPSPQSLKQIRDRSFSPDSFYLMPEGGGFCAYSLRPLGSPTFSLNDFFSTETHSLPALFGKPTSLEVPTGTPSSAAIFDTWNDQVFAPDIRGLRWFLVGDSEKYGDFIAGIVRYARQLHAEWRQSPATLLKTSWQTPEDLTPTGLPAPSFREAFSEMALFGNWMERQDPRLWEKIQPLLHYGLQMPKEACRNEITEDGYAYYTALENRVYLLPRSIHLLKSKNYPAVAQVLAHELAHWENAMAGFVLPSEELMERSLQLLVGMIAEEDPLWGLALAASGEYFHREMSCRRLPMIPEEEIDAFFSDLSYGRAQSPSSAETVAESVDAIVWLIDQVDRHFPPTWRSFMADYVRLAQAHHQRQN